MWYQLVLSLYQSSLLWTLKPDLVPHPRILSCLPLRLQQDPLAQRDMLRAIEGRLNQIQSSETLWPDNKALTYGLQMNCLFVLLSLAMLFTSLKLRVFNLQREVWNKCVCMCHGMCVSYVNQFHYMGVLHFICELNKRTRRVKVVFLKLHTAHRNILQ